MSKFYADGLKVKAGEGADGLFWIDLTSDQWGTVIVHAPTPAEAIAKLLTAISHA